MPVVGLTLRAGAMADRRSRRLVGAVTQLMSAAAALGLALVTHYHLPIWTIYALLFCSGIATAFNSPAVSALLPQMVPLAQLVKVNAWSSTSFQLSATVGPALAGLVLGITQSATPIFIAEAIAASAFAFILWRLPEPVVAHSTAPKPRPDRKDLMAGLRFVFETKELLAAITLDLFAVLLGGVNALLPIFAKDILHVGPTGLGWLQASPSLGSLLTALAQTRMRPWRHSGRVLLISVGGFGLAVLGFGFSRVLWLSMALLFLTGVFDALSVVIRRTLEQVVTPDRLRGRVSAVHYVFIGLSNELGEFESGVTAALLGPIGSVMLGGFGTLAAVIAAPLLWPVLLRLGQLDQIKPREDELHP